MDFNPPSVKTYPMPLVIENPEQMKKMKIVFQDNYLFPMLDQLIAAEVGIECSNKEITRLLHEMCSSKDTAMQDKGNLLCRLFTFKSQNDRSMLSQLVGACNLNQELRKPQLMAFAQQELFRYGILIEPDMDAECPTLQITVTQFDIASEIKAQVEGYTKENKLLPSYQIIDGRVCPVDQIDRKEIEALFKELNMD